MTSVNDRAQKLVELEKEREAEQEARDKERAEATRLDSARKRIRQHDREREQEQARKAAEVEAADLARELGEKAVELQMDAETLRESLESYADLRGRLFDAKRRSGRPVGGGRTASAAFLLGPWFRSIFGGQRSLVEVPSEMAGRARAVGHGQRDLIERDAFASPGDRDDVA